LNELTDGGHPVDRQPRMVNGCALHAVVNVRM
jgi:hypothetical protein